MTSRTKYPVTDEQLRAIFAKAGLGEVRGFQSMSDGWYNNVLDVAAGDGENLVEYVIKIAPAPGVRVLTHEAGLLRQELRFIALLRERTDVRVPQVFAGDLSKTLIPCDYFIMEKLGGVRLDKAGLRGEARAAVDQQVEDILAAFHGIAGAGFGYEQMGLSSNWHEALRAMARALVDDCAAFGQSCPMGERLLRHIDLHRELLESVPSVLVNFDLHDMNLFYKDGQLTVIDLERCLWGDWVGDCVVRYLTGPPKGLSREELIRFCLLKCYYGIIMYTEKYSRYSPWNFLWWADVAGSWLLWLTAYPTLKRLGKK